MRKFKHKPTGEVATLRNNYYVCKDSACIPIRFIEASCDWEEVVEKEYEILSLITNTFFGITTSKIDIEIFEDSNPLTVNYKIHSIKRLSDGEIFTIGDKVNMFKGVAVIISFRILSNKEFVIDFDNKCSVISIKNITKVKQPLFSTEDGVGIFCGYSYWCVNTAPHLWSIFEQVAKERTSLNKGVLAFSTKELAEDYLLMNRPILSLKDVFNILDKPLYKNHSNLKYIEEFKKEARSKNI